MLVPNDDIWKSRVQSVEALITASHGGRNDAYYAATTCQVSLDPPLISISPNPEYPICRTIAEGGHFAVNFLAADQRSVVARYLALDPSLPDKLEALGLDYETSERGTPLLRDCLAVVECRVERAFDSGDHRTVIGRVLDRRVREQRAGQSPRRFGGSVSSKRRLIKQAVCRSGAVDLLEAARGLRSPAQGIEAGTRRFVHAPPVPGRRVAPKPPGICLVGCGWWGGVHALEMRRLGPRIRRFFASRDPEKARAFAQRFGGEASFDGLDAALADPRVDAVLLALPHHRHAEAARSALRAGKHVLVEKPLATGLAEARDLVALAEAENLCLAVAEQYRLSPLVLRAGDLIEQGMLGRISLARTSVLANFRPSDGWKADRKAAGGGVLLDVGIHYVDILRTWFGEPEAVSASMDQSGDGVRGEEAVVALLRFPGGPLASVQVSWAAASSAGAPNIEVVGDQGSLALWFDRPYVQVTTPLAGGHWSRRLRSSLPWRVRQRIEGSLPTERRRRYRVKNGDLLGSRALLEDFAAAITTGREPAVPGREGLRDLEVVMTAYGADPTGAATRR